MVKNPKSKNKEEHVGRKDLNVQDSPPPLPFVWVMVGLIIIILKRIKLGDNLRNDQNPSIWWIEKKIKITLHWFWVVFKPSEINVYKNSPSKAVRVDLIIIILKRVKLEKNLRNDQNQCSNMLWVFSKCAAYGICTR